jgi:hypothetical protein
VRRAVLFDLDDTLFDHRRSAREALLQVHRVHARGFDFEAFARHHAHYLEEMHLEVLAGQLGDAIAVVPRHVAHADRASGRVSGQYDVPQLEYIDHAPEVVRQPVIIVPAPGPVGKAEAPVIDADAPHATLTELFELVLKQIVVAGPAVHEKYCRVPFRIKVLNIDFYLRFYKYIDAHRIPPKKLLIQSIPLEAAWCVPFRDRANT